VDDGMLRLIAELFLVLIKKTWLGLVLYLLRAFCVAVYSLVSVPIGGPGVDASVLQWIPFFIADLPWSMLFENNVYSTNTRALTVYAFVFGIPWFAYGVIFQQGLAWMRSRVPT
jgi:hypothetical protein